MRRPLFILACSIAPVLAQDEAAPAKKGLNIPSPELSLKSLAVEPGLKAELWAAEPLLENAVAFSFDDGGRAYVVETGRRRSSTLDIRQNESWVPEMLKFRSVADREAFLKTELAPEKKLRSSATRQDLNKDGQFDWRDLVIESERIQLVEDTDGDGHADKTRVFAEGFSTLATGTAAGVLPLPQSEGGAKPGPVLFTCIPDLWLVEPDGTKKSLSTGYGVHIAYSGHDMHGLRLGPDGRVYFSIADCGASVVGSDGAKVAWPDSGAVYRCWPDGRGLELFAKGLRNPQHLAFNDAGDLFTGDNNADGGDKARIIHVVEGADYGWRIGWQFLPKLGAWNSEGMWDLDAAETNAAILPPVAHIGHGPAGFSYYPGTGLPEKYQGHFFMADFPGGVRHFALKAKGATYTTADFAPDAPVLQDNKAGEMSGKLLWNLYPSDVQFPPGGGVMVLDWVQGWEKTGKGRIFKISAPSLENDAKSAETKRLLGEGMAKRSAGDLGVLLDHPDQRVRLEAQWELVRRKDAVTLVEMAKPGRGIRAQRHALWGLGQLGHGELAPPPAKDADPDYAVQMLRVLAGSSNKVAPSFAVEFLNNRNDRLRFEAAMTLAKIGTKQELPAVLDSLSRAKPGDAYVRFAFARALVQCAGSGLAEAVAPLRASAEQEVQLVGLLALRRAHDAHVADFLASKDERVRLEAARAIHDEPVPEALPALAALLKQPPTGPAGMRQAPNPKAEAAPSPLFRRAVNAAFRVGDAESAKLLAGAAANPAFPEAVRLDALDALAQWFKPEARDRVLGILMPGNGARKSDDSGAALAGVLDPLLSGTTELGIAALDTAAALKAKAFDSSASNIVIDPNSTPLAASPAARAAALRVLVAIGSPKLPDALKAALASKDKTLIDAAHRIEANASPAAGLAQAKAALKYGSVAEQREAIQLLGRIAQPGADEQLTNLLFRMKTGQLAQSLHLDVLEAAAQRTDPTVLGMIKEWDKQRPKNDPLAAWRECLLGGDAQAGREIFAEKAEVACMRCHAVAKQGGDVGPDLAGVATRHDRAYLLRSVIDPNGEIAPGYENVLVTLQDGNVVAGIATSEDAENLTVKNVADGKSQTVKKSTIKDRQKLPSAMPPGLGEALGKHGVRDLVEYLSTLK